MKSSNQKETVNKVNRTKSTKGAEVIPAENVLEIKSKKASTKKANEAVAVKKITDKKDLIYNYPADIDDLGKRKKFRTQTRAALKQLNKKINAIKAMGKKAPVDEKEALLKEISLFAKKSYQADSPNYKSLLKFA